MTEILEEELVGGTVEGEGRCGEERLEELREQRREEKEDRTEVEKEMSESEVEKREAEEETAEEESRTARLRALLARQGLGPGDLPKAVVVHEGLGLAVLGGAWAACLAASPSSRLFAALQERRATEWAAARARARSSGLVRWAATRTTTTSTAARLGVAFAESFFLRKLCAPVLVPAKLWLTYKIIILSKKDY